MSIDAIGSPSVKTVTITKETPTAYHVIIYSEKDIYSKSNPNNIFFESEKEAWQWLKDKAREEHNTAQRRADDKLFIFNKISEELKKHL